MTLTIDPKEKLDLSGLWQLAFDPTGEGLARGWMDRNWPEAQSDWVRVPAVWNVTHSDAEGVGFYRRIFVLPADWTGRALEIHFDGASYRAEVWLNGKYIGSHAGAYTPFWFDATHAARVGLENELVVRVGALSKTKDVDGMVLQKSPASKQSWYYVYGGLWGNVYIQAVTLLSCQAVVIEPDIDREAVLVDVAINNRQVECQQVDLELQILQANGDVAAERRSSINTPPGTTRFAYRLALKALADRGVYVELHFGIGNWMGCYHWIPDSDLSAGLPSGRLAGEVYAEVLPRYVMSELGGQVFAGSLRNTQTRRELPAMLWYSDIELVRLGKGGLLFCQYRVFERADSNPLSGELLLNLLRSTAELE